MSKVNEVLEIVKGMTVLELADLVKAMEEEFGVSAAAPVAAVAARPGSSKTRPSRPSRLPKARVARHPGISSARGRHMSRAGQF
ncbi:hypothetical protein ACP3TI_09520, partial [Desulforudis sp. 1190]